MPVCCYGDPDVSIETHLTLSHPAHADAALQAWLPPRSLTITRIELSHGVSSRQPMITLWAADRDGALREVSAIRTDLALLGVEVSRVKLEVVHVPGAGHPSSAKSLTCFISVAVDCSQASLPDFVLFLRISQPGWSPRGPSVKLSCPPQ